MQTSDLTTTVVLDIETRPSFTPPSVDEVKIDSRLKDPVKIKHAKENGVAKAWHDEGLNPLKGIIYCIGYKIGEEATKVIHYDDEVVLMEEFENITSQWNYPTIIAHNGYTFDFVYLFYKALKYRCRIVANIFSGQAGFATLVDTMKIMDGTAWKTMVSQDNMSLLLLGKPAKHDMDGSMVWGKIQEGKGKEVLSYCAKDVDALKECCDVLSELGLLTKHL